MSKKKILFFGSFDSSKDRHKILIKSIGKKNFDYCNIPVWKNYKSKSNLPIITLLIITISTFFSYIFYSIKYLKKKKYEFTIFSYPSYIDIIFFYLFCKLKNSTIVNDTYFSIYDTMVNDRKILRKKSIVAKLIYFLEKLSFSFSDIILIDTEEHKNYLSNLFKIKKDKFKVLKIGVDETKFKKKKLLKKKGPFKIFFFGDFSPLHGLDKILKAIKLNKNKKFVFIFSGKGQSLNLLKNFCDKYKKQKNVIYTGWKNQKTINKYIENSNVCLGIFGKSKKSQSVIPNKIYQIIQVGRPIVTANTRAQINFFKEDNTGVVFSKKNPRNILNSILKVYKEYNFYSDYLYLKLKNKISFKSIKNDFFIILDQSG